MAAQKSQSNKTCSPFAQGILKMNKNSKFSQAIRRRILLSKLKARY